jgi:hypothetical protein
LDGWILTFVGHVCTGTRPNCIDDPLQIVVVGHLRDVDESDTGRLAWWLKLAPIMTNYSIDVHVIWFILSNQALVLSIHLSILSCPPNLSYPILSYPLYRSISNPYLYLILSIWYYLLVCTYHWWKKVQEVQLLEASFEDSSSLTRPDRFIKRTDGFAFKNKILQANIVFWTKILHNNGWCMLMLYISLILTFNMDPNAIWLFFHTCLQISTYTRFFSNHNTSSNS